MYNGLMALRDVSILFVGLPMLWLLMAWRQSALHREEILEFSLKEMIHAADLPETNYLACTLSDESGPRIELDGLRQCTMRARHVIASMHEARQTWLGFPRKSKTKKEEG